MEGQMNYFEKEETLQTDQENIGPGNELILNKKNL
jgi:hypothetical protein